MQLGQGSLMGKFDVQNAYHIEPVHTEDRQLLGMKWRGDRKSSNILFILHKATRSSWDAIPREKVKDIFALK